MMGVALGGRHWGAAMMGVAAGAAMMGVDFLTGGG